MTDDAAHPATGPAPLISVLLPVHNGGAFLAEALDSVLSQTLGDLEVIAVENGSTDGSLRVLRDRAALDERLRVIDAGPVGLVAALNLAIGTARGRYLARMDADDIADPRRFDHQVHYLRTHRDIAVIGTAHDYIDSSGVTVGSRRFATGPDLVAASFYFGNPIAHPTVMIDRRRTGELTYPSEWPDAEDLALWLAISRSGAKVDNLGELLMHYRVHQDSVTAQPDAAVGSSDIDAVVAASRWPPRPCRWAVTRTFNVKGRRISIGSFLLGVIALNALNLVHREVKVWALLSRSTLAIAAGLPRPSRR